MARRTKEEIEKRHKEFTKAFEVLLDRLIEKEALEEYREFLICSILKFQTKNQYTRDDLLKKSTAELQDICENVE